ncbi:hypothetical protein C7377_1143 [Balneicella halophila]|uniref:Helicase HerA-like C-terminal domain-containing protein n=1 Tax=Balneicella halophila TaxID=1537566 RepID=A0A7L4UNW8_BALHA|nr:helicase HerA-like domain-containing protein [Balneicella halophila]PVX50825.1 hypothetical protein C7377_1143 [Balneicella halophila]
MNTIESFKAHIDKGNTFKGESLILGTAMLEGKPVQSTHVKVPLKTLNRHGLISGATGTGKTKSLQVLAEQMSLHGIPTLLMDMKGDLSGMAAEGSNNKHIEWRHGEIGIPYQPERLPVELFTLTDHKGVRLRSTITEFGPTLLSKILGLNATQQGIVAVVFKYCDDQKLPLIDLNDLKKVLSFMIEEGKKEIKAEYGSISKASVSTILRKVIELEQQKADVFFGERSFDPQDLLTTTYDGKGTVSIIRLADIQDKPKLFSTFMLSLLAEVYETFPEEGDLDKPKLAIFIDEAHLVFKNASKELQEQIESIIKLIRSKGVGIFFCTQNPTDIPDAVLSQLGLKIQHALRAFTAKDRENIRKVAKNYPITEYYDIEDVLTSLGIGEAFVTALNEKGIPTPLVATLMRAPVTRMDILTEKEVNDVVKQSRLVDKYAENINRESAEELLMKKIAKAEEQAVTKENKKVSRSRTKKEESFFETMSKNTMVRQLGRTLTREITRGLLGVLGVK